MRETFHSCFNNLNLIFISCEFFFPKHNAWRDIIKSSQKKGIWGFPGGGAVVRNPPANAGDVGSSPGPGRSHMPCSSWAHAPQLLSLRSGAREPQLLKPMRLEPVLRNGHRCEEPHTTARGGPHSPQREGAHAATRTQRSQK